MKIDFKKGSHLFWFSIGAAIFLQLNINLVNFLIDYYSYEKHSVYCDWSYQSVSCDYAHNRWGALYFFVVLIDMFTFIALFLDSIDSINKFLDKHL